jgi:hypothetical protein
MLAGQHQDIPTDIWESGSLPPQESPCYRVRYKLDTALLGTSKRSKVTMTTKTMMPGCQASIEWFIYQEKRLSSICDIVKLAHSQKIQRTDLWCHACKGRTATLEQFSNGFNSSVTQEVQSPKLEDATNVVKWILVELLTPDTNYITGLRKVKQILEKNKGREEKLHEKIKQEISKAWVKEQKRCKEQNLPVPPKPNVDTLTIVKDPLVERIEIQQASMERLLSFALMLHQKLGNGTEQEVNDHEDLEVLYYNAIKL